jgi:hypothetical protein
MMVAADRETASCEAWSNQAILKKLPLSLLSFFSTFFVSFRLVLMFELHFSSQKFPSLFSEIVAMFVLIERAWGK